MMSFNLNPVEIDSWVVVCFCMTGLSVANHLRLILENTGYVI